MNFINKTLCITALFTISSVAARTMGNSGGAAAALAAVSAPVINQAPAVQAGAAAGAQAPAAGQAQSYKQLHDNILRMNQAEVVSGNFLKGAFIERTLDQAKSAGIDANGLRFLLQTARDKFAPFTGNNNDDLGILRQINNQIEMAAKDI